MTTAEVALGFIDVANEAMCRPIRALTQARGLDASKHVLACFGGAGGQHACAIARALGMQTVFVHQYASVLSAVGMGLASIVQEGQVLSVVTFTSTLNKKAIDSNLLVIM
jgi:5-oxoprolinase (ATP-hydrolysing)